MEFGVQILDAMAVPSKVLITLEEQLAQELTIASQISGFVILVLCSPKSY